jgi:hypothetical protein
MGGGGGAPFLAVPNLKGNVGWKEGSVFSGSAFFMMKSIVYRGSVLWNKLPNYCQECFYTTLMTSLKDSDFLDTITNFSVY